MLTSLPLLQAAPPQPGLIEQLFPILLIVVIFYFLLIRPQQKRAREHREMVAAVKRGDTVVTAGGLIGKVTKVRDEGELEVELAPEVRVRVIGSTLNDVRSKGAPVADKTADKPASGKKLKGKSGGGDKTGPDAT